MAHGFQYDGDTPGMAIDLAALPQPAAHPLTIRPVEKPQMLPEWNRVLVRGFEMPAEMEPGFLSLIQSLAPLYEARELGYRAGVLQSSRMGYGVYQRLGFQKLCQVDHFYWQAESA